jgi:hypothetical protein
MSTSTKNKETLCQIMNTFLSVRLPACDTGESLQNWEAKEFGFVDQWG